MTAQGPSQKPIQGSSETEKLFEELNKAGILYNDYLEHLKSLVSLGFAESQGRRIIFKKNSKNIVLKLIEIFPKLNPRFTCEQMTKVAVSSGSKGLSAMEKCGTDLAFRGFSDEQIVKMAALPGGDKNLETVQKYNTELIKLSFEINEIVQIVAQSGGAKKLEVAIDNKRIYNSLFSKDAEAVLSNADVSEENLTPVMSPTGNIEASRHLPPEDSLTSIASTPASPPADDASMPQNQNESLTPQCIITKKEQGTPATELINSTLENSEPMISSSHFDQNRDFALADNEHAQDLNYLNDFELGLGAELNFEEPLLFSNLTPGLDFSVENSFSAEDVFFPELESKKSKAPGL